MRTVINKVGNIEIENNLLKFRMPINEFKTDNISIIEKSIKRKMTSIENDPYYLKPFEIQVMNSFVVLYYQMDNYAGFTYLRQIPFGDKLKYYSALIDIAKKQDETKVLWDKYNFFVDPLEETMKTIVFETENMSIHEKIDAFSGIKELILISLTTLETILGKPNRTDFIEQDNDVIQFAETILKIEDLDDLDHYVSTKRIEYEHGMIGNDNTVQSEKKAKSISLSSIKGRINKKKIKPSNKNINSQGTKSKNKGNKNLYMLIGLLIFALIVHFATSSDPSSADNKEVEKKSTNEYAAAKETKEKENKNKKKSVKTTDSKYNEQLLSAYRASLTGDAKGGAEILEQIGYKNLSEQDQNILLNIYENSGQINKVIDLKPERAKELVNSIVANNQADTLIDIQKAMETKNEYVDFEVAFLKEDWKKIIELKDLVDLNGRKEEQIVQAFISLKNLEEAKKFAEQVGNPALLEQVQTYSTTN